VSEQFTCPICKSHNCTQVGNDKVGYGLVQLDLVTKKVIGNPNPEYLAFNIYICSDCKHVDFKIIPLKK